MYLGIIITSQFLMYSYQDEQNDLESRITDVP